MRLEDSECNDRAVEFRYVMPYQHYGRGSRPDSVSIETTSSEAVVRLPGKLYVQGTFYEDIRELPDQEKLTLIYSVKPSGAEYEIRKSIVLRPAETQGKDRRWTLGTEDDEA
ncbi:hypothetical protein LIP_3375 [Limnochorda pilosa]|uniref:Uncharacterized protein n=1 Tax=Limnochorda pilosa TaxID=1555112 RepID=A0A0K2SQC0_LIMPI|nr:hypothetical protein LIP_3375 [Limnochorda pilosa]